MTEQAWLARADVAAMLGFLNGKARARELRLFACACCRGVWHSMTDRRGQKAVEIAERFVDGDATTEELAEAQIDAEEDADPLGACNASMDALCAAAWTALPDMGIDQAKAVASSCASAHSEAAVDKFRDRHGRVKWCAAAESVHRAALAVAKGQNATLLVDIVGNPFRPVSIDPAWLTPKLRDLAQSAYAGREMPSGLLHPSRLSSLADALEAACWTNKEIVAHCRTKGPHVKGCWVI